ncbi:hypothetical protein ACLOJK_010536 [Asimina triloba]
MAAAGHFHHVAVAVDSHHHSSRRRQPPPRFAQATVDANEEDDEGSDVAGETHHGRASRRAIRAVHHDGDDEAIPDPQPPEVNSPLPSPSKLVLLAADRRHFTSRRRFSPALLPSSLSSARPGSDDPGGPRCRCLPPVSAITVHSPDNASARHRRTRHCSLPAPPNHHCPPLTPTRSFDLDRSI